MKIKLLAILGMLLYTGLLRAQTDYRQGYVLLSAVDTVYGDIDYRGDIQMGRICRFRTTDNVITEYTPYDIYGYRFVNSKYYISKEINGKRMFLEYLVKGEVDIFYLRADIQDDHYYIDKAGEPLSEIPYEEGIRNIDEKRIFYESTRHIGFLNYYMRDDPGFKEKTEKIRRPEHRNLIKLAEDYHNAVCGDEGCVVYEKTLPLLKLSIEPFYGYKRFFDPYVVFYVREMGSNLYFWMPRVNENWYFKTGFTYSSILPGSDNIRLHKIPMQFQYIYSAHKFMPKAGIGWNAYFEDKVFVMFLKNMSVGFNYSIMESISIDLNLSSDFYTHMNNTSFMFLDDMAIDFISFSIDVGLCVDL